MLGTIALASVGAAVALGFPGRATHEAAVVPPVPTLCPAAPATSGTIPDPDAGLTDAQKDAKHQDFQATFEGCYAAWAANFDSSTVDLTALPHQLSNADPAPPKPSLEAVTAYADVIVVGTFRSARPLPPPAFLTEVTLDVTRV